MLVIEISIRANLIGREIFNIYHVVEPTGLVPLDSILDIFEASEVDALAPLRNVGYVTNLMTATPLDALDTRTATSRTLSTSGTVLGTQSMPTGVHVFSVLQTAGIGLKSGGKLLAGWDENGFTAGNPTNGLLDGIQLALNGLLADLLAGGISLAVYRPTFSIAGLPVASLVTEITVRGDSTNNRRRQPFER